MATLNLTRLWLNRTDTGVGISGASGRERTASYAVDGSVRKYASGRMRSITTPGTVVQVPRTLVALDYTTKELLLTWLGLNVQLRDHRGNRWFGVFFSVEISEYMAPNLYQAAITLNVTTTTEGV